MRRAPVGACADRTARELAGLFLAETEDQGERFIDRA